MLFGEFLIEKKLIKEEQLLEALCLQVEEQPSPLSIVFSSKLLDPKKILELLKIQGTQELGFFEALSKCYPDSKLLKDKILSELKVKRRPLGEILVEKKYITLESLTKSLDEYFSKGPQKKISEEIPVKDANIFASLDSEFLAGLEKMASDFSNAQKIEVFNLEKYSNDLHRAFGAAKLFENSLAAHLFENFEKILRLLNEKSFENIPMDLKKKVQSSLFKAKELLMACKTLEAAGGLQTESLAGGDLSLRYKDLLDSFLLLDFDLSHIPKKV